MGHSTLWLGVLAATCVAITSAFTNPIKTLNGSDPFMVYWDGMYYMTTTTWSNVEITTASTIEGLKTATPRVVYTDTTNPLFAKRWWAPEMWRVNDRWYVYFSTSEDLPSWDLILPSLRIWALEGGSGTPLSEPYKLVSEVRPPNYHGGMLDPSIYNIGGKDYFFFSSVNGAESPNGASLWIAEMRSPSDIGPATMISFPEHDWERDPSPVLEGPAGITSPNGTIFMVYSANSCNTQDYALGALQFQEGADPLLASSWTKLPEPLLTTSIDNGMYGPGHNGFFKSPDGTQDWMIFHANRDSRGSCDAYRQTFVQPVHWDCQGRPKLNPPLAPGVEITPPQGERPSNHT
ncbi:hypothetical protein DL765_006262 [Monosporascus sp. GIB2]|nr:hypothetical protein DL765_006262 [Monosporascus sp. GIB2]